MAPRKRHHKKPWFDSKIGRFRSPDGRVIKTPDSIKERLSYSNKKRAWYDRETGKRVKRPAYVEPVEAPLPPPPPPEPEANPFTVVTPESLIGFLAFECSQRNEGGVEWEYETHESERIEGTIVCVTQTPDTTGRLTQSDAAAALMALHDNPDAWEFLNKWNRVHVTIQLWYENEDDGIPRERNDERWTSLQGGVAERGDIAVEQMANLILGKMDGPSKRAYIIGICIRKYYSPFDDED